MKKLILFMMSISLLSSATLSAQRRQSQEPLFIMDNVTDDIPKIDIGLAKQFKKVCDVAQYGKADWSQAIGLARGISLQEAYRIADENPEITYFFFMKGYSMALRTEQGAWLTFGKGDTVFFTGEPWWGSAEGLADGYLKISTP